MSYKWCDNLREVDKRKKSWTVKKCPNCSAEYSQKYSWNDIMPSIPTPSGKCHKNLTHCLNCNTKLIKEIRTKKN